MGPAKCVRINLIPLDRSWSRSRDRRFSPFGLFCDDLVFSVWGGNFPRSWVRVLSLAGPLVEMAVFWFASSASVNWWSRLHLGSPPPGRLRDPCRKSQGRLFEKRARLAGVLRRKPEWGNVWSSGFSSTRRSAADRVSRNITALQGNCHCGL